MESLPQILKTFRITFSCGFDYSVRLTKFKSYCIPDCQQCMSYFLLDHCTFQKWTCCIYVNFLYFNETPCAKMLSRLGMHFLMQKNCADLATNKICITPYFSRNTGTVSQRYPRHDLRKTVPLNITELLSMAWWGVKIYSVEFPGLFPS